MFLDVLPIIILPLHDDTNVQEVSKNQATFLPIADSGIQSPDTPPIDDNNYQKLTISPLPPLQTPIFLMTPTPIRAPTLLRTTPLSLKRNSLLLHRQKKKKFTDFISEKEQNTSALTLIAHYEK